MDPRRRVGQNIRELRKALGLSQEEASHRCDLHQTYLSGVESGRRNPTVLVLDRIAKALGVDLADLVRKRPD